MDMLAYLGKAVALGFSAAILPGSFQAYVVSEAARRGWRRAALLPFAPLLSDLPVILITVLALGAVPGVVLDILQLVGGLFVLYLAWRALQGTRLQEDESGSQTPQATGHLLRAATINLLNPSVYIYWATVSGPLLIQGWETRPAIAVGFLAVFYGTLVLAMEALVLLVGRVGALNRRLSRALVLVSAVAMVAFAVVQIVQGAGALASAG